MPEKDVPDRSRVYITKKCLQPALKQAKKHL